jgi:protein SCO1/2
MNKFLKAGILLVTLAIPVFIWLFLKNFGQNQFDLPAYYVESIPEISGCDDLNAPHVIPDFSAQGSLPNGLSSALLTGQISVSYLLPDSCDESCTVVLEELANLQTLFAGEDQFQIVIFAGPTHEISDLEEMRKKYLGNPATWKFVSMKEDSFDALARCGYLLSEVAYQHVLILNDAERRIRGYYAGTQSAEVDRLKGELKILLYMQELAAYD